MLRLRLFLHGHKPGADGLSFGYGGCFRIFNDCHALAAEINIPLLPTLTRRGYFYFSLLFAFALKLFAAVGALHGMEFIWYIGFVFFALHYSP